MKLLQFHAHLHPELGVEIGERFVEEEDVRRAHDGAADGDALALAAGECGRLAREQVGEPEHGCDIADALVDLGLRDALQLERHRHVLEHGLVRIERIVLEDHGDAAILGIDVVHRAALDAQFAARNVLEAGDHAQRRRLSAARRPEQDDELPLGDGEVDTLDGDDAAEGLAKISKLNLCHGRLYFPTPAVRPPTICFWKMAVTTRIGMIARTVAVEIVSHGKEYSPG